MARRRVAARRPFARSICLIRHLLFVPAIGAVAVLAPQSAAAQDADAPLAGPAPRSEEHTSELQPLMRNSYADVCLTKILKSLHSILRYPRQCSASLVKT